MRGEDVREASLFSYVDLESRVPRDHPLRSIRALVDQTLERLWGDFETLYADSGRSSVPPEQLLRALLLQAFYSIRSERQLMEQLDYNLLFRWFVGLQIDDRVWHPTTFTKNRERLLQGQIARRFLYELMNLAEVTRLLSDEHFSIDGTMIDAWASMKSVRPRDDDDGPSGGGGRNADVDFRGQRRTNETHASTTDPQARLYRKGPGQPARLCYLGHALMENRSALILGTALTPATGTAERQAALAMIDARAAARRRTLALDAGYHDRTFVRSLRQRRVTPHIAMKRRYNSIDGRTTRHAGYAISMRIRKRIEEFFGWAKDVGGVRKTRFIGPDKVGWQLEFAAAAYNLIRLPKLMGAAP